MPKNNNNNDQWTVVDRRNQHGNNELRTVSGEIKNVFLPLASFVENAVVAKLTDCLRQRTTPCTEIIVQQTPRVPWESFDLTIRITGVPRRKVDSTKALIDGIEVCTRPVEIGCYVDPSRCRFIQLDLKAAAFWDALRRHHKITVVKLPGETVDALIQNAVNYLKVKAAGQQPRRHQERAPPPPQAPLTVEDAIRATATMAPSIARPRLEEILTQLESNDPYSDVVTFFVHLAQLEYHYIIACLGEYECETQRLHLSKNLADALILHRQPNDPWFSDRRPSVEKGDVVVATSNATGKVFKTFVLFMDKDKLYLAGDAVEVVQDKSKKTQRPKFLEKGRKQDAGTTAPSTEGTLSHLASQNDAFDIIFDDERFAMVSAARVKFARLYGEPLYAFLITPVEATAWEIAQKRVNAVSKVASTTHEASDDDDDDNEKQMQPQRRERGGRGVAPGRPTPSALTADADEDDSSDLCGHLDKEQKSLVSLIEKPVPHLRKIKVDGPGGTGKTEALCCAAANFITKFPGRKVLYLAFTKNACNVAGRRLVELLKLTSGAGKTLLRLHSGSESPLDADPPLYCFSNLEDPSKEMSRLTLHDKFYDPRKNMDKISAYSIVVTSVANAKLFSTADVVIVDEAAQCGLIEGLQALQPVVGNPRCILVLGGDPKQTTPPCHFPRARKHLHQSVYSFCHDDCAFTIRLRNSHRASRHLTALFNRAIYNNELIVKDSPTDCDDHQLYTVWAGHRGCPRAVRFIHIEEPIDTKDAQLTIAAKERAAVVSCAASLLGTYPDALNQSDVVVLTAHRDQQREIREKLQWVGLKALRVTDADSYQGSEAKIILVSLVNQGDQHVSVPFPPKHTLTSIITRAKHLVIFVGNLNALSASREWRDWQTFVKDKDVAVESFDGTVFTETFVQLPIPQLSAVKEYAPAKKLQHDLLAAVELTEMKVLGEPELYFVGTVVGYDDVSQSPIVRNLSLHCCDVLVDQDVNPNRNDLLWRPIAMIGDLVAVKLVPNLSRWLRLEMGDLCHFRVPQVACATVPPPPHDQRLQTLRQRSKVRLPEDFPTIPLSISCLPPPLLSLPRGVIACILQRGALPAVAGVPDGKMFVPHSPSFPTLPFEIGQGRGPLFGQLQRPPNALPFYSIVTGRPASWAVPTWQPKLAAPSAFNGPEICELIGNSCAMRIRPTVGAADNVAFFFPVVLLSEAPLPTSEQATQFVPPAGTQGPHLVENQVQEAVMISFRHVGNQIEDVRGEIVLVRPLRPRFQSSTEEMMVASSMEMIANAAAAQFLLKNLRPLALFLRQDLLSTFDGDTRNTCGVGLPEVWMQPTVPQSAVTQGACGTFGRAVYPVMTRATRTRTTFFDCIVVAQLRLAALLDQGNTKDSLDDVEVQDWLRRIPQACVWLNGCIRCDPSVLSL